LLQDRRPKVEEADRVHLERFDWRSERIAYRKHGCYHVKLHRQRVRRPDPLEIVVLVKNRWAG